MSATDKASPWDYSIKTIYEDRDQKVLAERYAVQFLTAQLSSTPENLLDPSVSLRTLACMADNAHTLAMMLIANASLSDEKDFKECLSWTGCSSYASPDPLKEYDGHVQCFECHSWVPKDFTNVAPISYTKAAEDYGDTIDGYICHKCLERGKE